MSILPDIISGYVMFTDGTPVENAHVSLFGNFTKGEITGADGHFSLGNLISPTANNNKIYVSYQGKVYETLRSDFDGVIYIDGLNALEEVVITNQPPVQSVQKTNLDILLGFGIFALVMLLLTSNQNSRASKY